MRHVDMIMQIPVERLHEWISEGICIPLEGEERLCVFGVPVVSLVFVICSLRTQPALLSDLLGSGKKRISRDEV